MKVISAFSRASVARTLESHRAAWPGAGLLASAYGAFSRRGVCRPLEIPDATRVIGVGAATLGGSGKTPLALAVARALAERGESVAFVGHAYRARPRFARVVAISDDVRAVGDEALLAARTLSPLGIEVIVAATRQAAVSFAARRARCLVVDGLLQTQPQRLARSVLVLDAEAPWGNTRFPPAGDLRAPCDALLDAADLVAVVRDETSPASANLDAGDKRLFEVVTRVDQVRDGDGRAVALGELASRRAGLLVAVARPQRMADTLARRGIHLAATIAFGDHDQPSTAYLERAVSAASSVDLWLTTAKCATKLPHAIRGIPVFVLDHRLEVPDGLISAIA